jgi:hypothetical protein
MANREAGMLLCWLSLSASTIEVRGRRSTDPVLSRRRLLQSTITLFTGVRESMQENFETWLSHLNHEGCFVHT